MFYHSASCFSSYSKEKYVEYIGILVYLPIIIVRIWATTFCKWLEFAMASAVNVMPFQLNKSKSFLIFARLYISKIKFF